MSFIAHTCNGNPTSHMANSQWNSFSTKDEAKKYIEDWCDGLECGCTPADSLEVFEDPKMPPNESGWEIDYPQAELDYQVLRGELKITLDMAKYLRFVFMSMKKWGHTPHWISAALAAYADGEAWEGEKVTKLLMVAFGLKGGPEKKEQDELYNSCRILNYDDFNPGRRLSPIGELVHFEEPK